MANKNPAPKNPPLLDYQWTVDGRPDGKLRKAGDPVKMTEAQAKYHLQMGHLKLMKGDVKAPSKPAQKPRKPRGKTGEPETAEDPATQKKGDEPEA